jgi:ketosteroid isomerase-like protein
MTTADSKTRLRNLEAVREMMARFSAGDADGLLAHVADDIHYEAPYYASFPTVQDKERMAAMLAAVESRFSSVEYRVVDLFPTIDPNLVVAEIRGNHQVAGSDKRYQNHYIQFIRFRDGKVVHWREFSNPEVYREAVQGDGEGGEE